jgi:peroxiredoxin
MLNRHALAVLAAPAPAFTLTDHHGENVSLAELTRTGPAVLVFYRGHW